MNRQEVAEKLCALGYRAHSIDGVAQVLVDRPMKEDDVRKLEGHLADMGYRSSWGWKVAG